jgi:hypothetical protein
MSVFYMNAVLLEKSFLSVKSAQYGVVRCTHTREPVGVKAHGSFPAKSPVAVTKTADLWQKVGREIGFPVSISLVFFVRRRQRYFLKLFLKPIYRVLNIFLDFCLVRKKIFLFSLLTRPSHVCYM